MAFFKGLLLLFVALTMVLSLSITLNNKQPSSLSSSSFQTNDVHDSNKMDLALPSKRVSRFLVANNPVSVAARNPNAADHCKKDNEICYLLEPGKNSTCCSNKCVDLQYDDKNCGACKNKCKFTQTCCRGQCVELSFDKRHCGACNHRCELGEFCVYGMCNYA
ncbi:stigma-specific STIG1-like protein 1 [Prosopis cineraria]|uniref:stigma-specific STIG1-like protein 1 n=1 Tax=Prosopis cineraria TaxID=364024 RepID=UPI0024107AE9|nr:stigma-specific STIG1-like protein 1 [Prosopis cineraria]XP_054817371.1 stigma-specific STIG1-like protein 1 [Prosopis cineraria]